VADDSYTALPDEDIELLLIAVRSSLTDYEAKMIQLKSKEVELSRVLEARIDRRSDTPTPRSSRRVVTAETRKKLSEAASRRWSQKRRKPTT
jgi:hypothetical protein